MKVRVEVTETYEIEVEYDGRSFHNVTDVVAVLERGNTNNEGNFWEVPTNHRPYRVVRIVSGPRTRYDRKYVYRLKEQA